MTLQEARELLRKSRGRGRPSAEIAAKLRQAKKLVAQNPTPLSPKRVSLQRRKNPIAEPPRKRGRPRIPRAETPKVVRSRGRPVGSKDTKKRKPKITKKARKKNKYVDFPVMEVFVTAGPPGLTKYMAKLDDKELRKEARMTVKQAKEIMGVGKGRGRPSALTRARKQVAEEIAQRSSKARGKSTPKRATGRKRIGRATFSSRLVDKFRLKRKKKRSRGRERKRQTRATKALPKKK